MNVHLAAVSFDCIGAGHNGKSNVMLGVVNLPLKITFEYELEIDRGRLVFQSGLRAYR